MNELYLFALANLAICTAIFFIAICRINAMDGDVLLRVQSEYTAYLAGALFSAAQPWWGEWPRWGALAIGGALLFGLLCSGHAWRHGRQDVTPEVATDHAAVDEDFPPLKDPS